MSGRLGSTVLIVLLLLAAPLAGCLGDDGGQDGSDGGPEAPDDGDDGPGGSSGDAGDGSDGTGDQDEGDAGEPADPLGDPISLGFQLAPDRSLETASVEEGSVPMAGSFSGFVSELDLTVFRSEPVTSPVLIHDEPVTLQLWLEAQSPTPSGGDDVVVWFGSTRGIHLLDIASIGEPVMTPGEPVLVEVELAFDGTRPLVVPSGERALLYVVTTNNEERAENLHILTGGETASRLDLTASTFGVDPLADLGAVDETTLEGSIPANAQLDNCDVEEGVTTQTHEITVAEEAAYLELNLTSAEQPGHQDMDMQLLDGDDLVASTVSPYAWENILLAGPTLQGLEGSQLTVKVYGCFAQETSYEVAVQQAPSTVDVDWTAG